MFGGLVKCSHNRGSQVIEKQGSSFCDTVFGYVSVFSEVQGDGVKANNVRRGQAARQGRNINFLKPNNTNMVS